MCHFYMSLKIDGILQIPVMASMGQYKLTPVSTFQFWNPHYAAGKLAIETLGSAFATAEFVQYLSTVFNRGVRSPRTRPPPLLGLPSSDV